MKYLKIALSLAVIFGLAYCARQLATLNKHIEFPIWAALLGMIVGNLPYISLRIKTAANTEWFIRIGLVLLGASVNFAVIVNAGWRGIVQALIGVPLVFFFTWYVAKLFKLDEKLRAVMATALSVCGVSAAIAAAGSVDAKKEQLTYVIALVTLFALPLMFVMPLVANLLNLPQSVAGAWIGNNIDTTAAVTGAATIYGAEAAKIASIVKMSQNTLIGLAAFLLALWSATKLSAKKPSPKVIWSKFPKFVLGFIAVSLLVTFGLLSKSQIAVISDYKNWFFTFAFVCIGMTFDFKAIKQVGGKPLLVFALATLFNTVTALALAHLLFRRV